MKLLESCLYRQVSTGQIFLSCSCRLIPLTNGTKCYIDLLSIDFDLKSVGEYVIAIANAESDSFELMYKDDIVKYTWPELTNTIKNKYKPAKEYTFETAAKDIHNLLDMKILIDNNLGAAATIGYVSGIRPDGFFVKTTGYNLYSFAAFATSFRSALTGLPIGPE